MAPRRGVRERRGAATRVAAPYLINALLSCIFEKEPSELKKSMFEEHVKKPGEVEGYV